MSRAMKPRPLWRCPKCGKYYVTRNMWHACARHTVAEHFIGRDPKLKFLFDCLVGLVKRNGPLRVVPGKSGIAFQQRMRFGGVVVRKDSLEAGFVLPRRLDHPRIKRLIAYTPHAFGHQVEIRTPADLDDELAAWLRESYRVGQQLDSRAGKRAAPGTKGDFAWSEPSFFVSRRAKADVFGAWTSRGRATRRRASLWKCPKCGRTFPSRNQFHICSRLTLAEALQGKSPQAIALFRKLAALARRFGPLKIVPQKTRIALQARKTFLGVKFLRDAIECELTLAHRIEHPRFAKILSVSPRAHYHYLRISDPAEFDRDVRSWFRESYRAGQQAHLLENKKAPVN